MRVDVFEFMRVGVMLALAGALLFPLMVPLLDRLDRRHAAKLNARRERERQELEATRMEAMADIQKETN